MRFRHLISAAAAVLCSATGYADFDIRDGDTVAFLGDSITASRQYGKLIETYTLLRYPERKVRFINVGQGGETAKGSLTRLDKDVFGAGATVLTVAYGINDIGWGTKADETHKREYLDSIGEIIDRCKAHGVRVYICSAAITAEDPDKAENNFLQKMCDEGLDLAKSKGAGAIDVQRTMREVQRRVINANAAQKDKDKNEPTRMHVKDGIHLNDLGQLAMAYAILKGLGAPADVSSAVVDAAASKTIDAKGCQISDVSLKDGELSFIRLDEGLPLNLYTFWVLQQLYVPIGSELNKYELAIRNLPEGKYAITAGGRGLGQWSANDLARGINIASATADPWHSGGPWDAQARVIKIFTDMRDELVFASRDMQQELTSHGKLTELTATAQDIENRIVALQRATARPIPVQFVIRKVSETAKAKAPDFREYQYGEAAGEKLMLDVYLPPGDTAPGTRRAGILLIHGGGWIGGNRKDVTNEAKAVAKAGYVAVSIGYRLCNGPARDEDPSQPVRNRYPAQIDDCQRAVRWVRKHASEFQLDPDRLGAVGWSAGGHLVSLLGTLDTRDNSDPDLAAFSSRVQSVVNVFGPTDFTVPLPTVTLAGAQPDPKGDTWAARRPIYWLVDDLLGSKEADAQKAASPIYHIDAKTVPFLIVHGAQDYIVPVEQSRAFARALKSAGVDAQLMEFADDGHGFGKPANQKAFAESAMAFFQRTLAERKN